MSRPTMAHQGQSASAFLYSGSNQLPSLLVVKIANGCVTASKLRNMKTSSFVSLEVAFTVCLYRLEMTSIAAKPNIKQTIKMF